MIAIIELILVGLLVFLLIKMTATQNRIREHKRMTLQQIKSKITSEYWMYFIVPVVFIVGAIATSFSIIDWRSEMRILLFSAFLLFVGLFIFTAAYLRMREEI